jgi:probable HAF family extracellular repeat protein
MKRSIGTAMLVTALVAGGSTGFATLAGAQTASASRPHYTVINLGTLGGLQSNGYGGPTNNGEWVSGDSSLSSNVTEHAALWRRDVTGQFVVTDLGPPGGLNSSTGQPPENDIGLIVGNAQSSQIDPLGENWGAGYGCPNANPCTGYQSLGFGFVWQNGVMTALPTLGGNYSYGTAANNLGQVVGWAETATPDSSCVPPQVLDYNAVVWGPRKGEVHELPTLAGDAIAGAAQINDNGDVVGFSGVCGVPTGAVAAHAVLWRNGSVFNLRGLGGVMNNVAFAINNAGQIAGQSDPPGDQTTHAVLWQKNLQNGEYAAIDLGALPGDVYSSAEDINAQGQVVGVSCDANSYCRAFLWDKGVMMDLNSLIPSDSPLYLTYSGGINDRGEIAGSACVQSGGECTGESPAFLAIPAPTAQIAGDSVKRVKLPANVRASLQRRLRLGHFGVGPTAQQ